MEVDLVVPKGTDVSVVESEYGELLEDEVGDDEYKYYWAGQTISEDEREGHEYLRYDQCVEFCGFCEGAIPGASTLIEGNGDWAQSMISRRDFSGFAVSEAEKQDWKKTSDRYWEAHSRGVAAAEKHAEDRAKCS